jgi:hypothetical protein
VPLQYPFTSFMTATERGGSPPANDIELLGDAAGRPGISYARVSLLNPVLADFTWTTAPAATGTMLRLDGSSSKCTEGRIKSWQWELGGAKASGRKVEHLVAKGGPLPVALAVTDGRGNTRRTTRTVNVPPTPQDLGLKRWGLVMRTEAEGFSAEGGGAIHVRSDKLSASGLSLSHWNTKGHWLEWEFSVPREDDYLLLARYATPENAARAVTVDGQAQPLFRFPASGGYGSDQSDNWALAALGAANGKPLALRLSAGEHTIRLANPDGTGLNLDYLDWVARSSPVPAAAETVGTRLVGDQAYRYLLPLSGVLAPSRMASNEGFAYAVTLGKQYPGEGADQPPSTLRLLEDSKELGPAHAAHVDIREKGQGRYSHWGEGLIFSASDNTDPRSNGRKYTWELGER